MKPLLDLFFLVEYHYGDKATGGGLVLHCAAIVPTSVAGFTSQLPCGGSSRAWQPSNCGVQPKALETRHKMQSYASSVQVWHKSLVVPGSYVENPITGVTWLRLCVNLCTLLSAFTSFSGVFWALFLAFWGFCVISDTCHKSCLHALHQSSPWLAGSWGRKKVQKTLSAHCISVSWHVSPP
jgi:hypothetical protein